MGLRPLGIPLRDSNVLICQIQLISNYDKLIFIELINALNGYEIADHAHAPVLAILLPLFFNVLCLMLGFKVGSPHTQAFLVLK